ncbi:MAG: beta-glucanase precursor [Verrucomicrobia bacterium]|nr:beta-glucanase precursor [Verrucomicrobiota bacterium]
MLSARLIILAAVAGILCVGASYAADFGDFSSSTLTSKAWDEMGKGNYDEALVYINKCKEMYEAEALKQQAGLSSFAPKENGHDYWALNDVGTCYYIEGQIREKQGDTASAIAAYKKLAGSLKYCQCWDNKGWFWHPAEAAEGRLKQLEFESILDQ